MLNDKNAPKYQTTLSINNASFSNPQVPVADSIVG